MAPGWRGKETYKLLGADEFIEVFELAAPGKKFEVYVENHFKRQKGRNRTGRVAHPSPSS
jgi:hypothetical protein